MKIKCLLFGHDFVGGESKYFRLTDDNGNVSKDESGYVGNKCPNCDMWKMYHLKWLFSVCKPAKEAVRKVKKPSKVKRK
jgi:hypothetical protein